MYKYYKILRAILVALIALPPMLAVSLYIILSLPWAQDALRMVAERDLSKLLGTTVNVGSVNVFPFDKINVSDVSVHDDFGAEALRVKTLTAGVDLYRLVASRRIVIDYVALSGVNATLYKTKTDGSLNISGIIERLKPKDKNQPPKSFDLKINTFVLDDGAFAFFDESAVDPVSDRFDPRHIRVYDLNLAVNLPKVSNDQIDIMLYSLSLRERCGFEIDNLRADIHIKKDSITVGGISAVLPRSDLELGSISIPKNLITSLSSSGPGYLPDDFILPVVIKDGSYVTPADLKAFVPDAAAADMPVYVTLNASLSDSLANINTLRIYEPSNNLLFDLEGFATDITSPRKSEINFHSIRFTADGLNVASYVQANFPKASKVAPYLRRLGSIEFLGSIKGSMDKGAHFIGNLMTDAGDMDIDASMHPIGPNYIPHIMADLSTSQFDLNDVLPSRGLGLISGSAKADILLMGKHSEGAAELNIRNFEYKGYVYSDIEAIASRQEDVIEAGVKIKDTNLALDLSVKANTDPIVPELNLAASLGDFRPDVLGLTDKYPGYTMSAELKVNFLGTSFEDADGEIRLSDLKFVDNDDRGLHVNEIRINANNSERPRHIDLHSDFIDGTISGRYDFASLVPITLDMVSRLFPALTYSNHSEQDTDSDEQKGVNDFDLQLTLKPHSELYSFFNLPVSIIENTDITAKVNSSAGTISLYSSDIHYLQQGKNRLLYDTMVNLDFDTNDKAWLYATTTFDTKKGPMSVDVFSTGKSDTINTHIEWEIARTIPIEGEIDLVTNFDRKFTPDPDRSNVAERLPLLTKVRFSSGKITFGETLWNIMPSDIEICKKDINIKNFLLTSGQEQLRVDGHVSENPEDVLIADLNSVELIDIFETLQINKALIGGRATGRISASSLLTKQPLIKTENLSVDSISYNYCVLGNATVEADFDASLKAFRIGADISQANGDTTYIDGKILAGSSELDITFDTQKVNIGFLRPFMSAFAKNIGGTASGKARIFGSFKNINLEGDILADSVNLGIAITNTDYYVKGDSLHMRPGKILFDNITLHDRYGNSAKFNGELTHDYFHNAAFHFDITDIDRMLVFDTTRKINPRWYGHILASGWATIDGAPGFVDIIAKMSTAPQTTFNFALLDMVDAGDYSFLDFRDRTEKEWIDTLIEVDTTPEIVKTLKHNAAHADDAASKSAYDVNLDVDVTDAALITIEMDPMSSDCIRASGEGNLVLNYDSKNENLAIKGTYTIERGKYNFTLQDIILRDFNILSGSKISFSGDPYAATLGVRAAYTIQANLADLDPSFAEDKDINRRVVPVNAILLVNGDIRQPEIDYDFEFPASSDDVYRRAMSVMGTPEMKQRQILYLLALNRFYTPDYMASTKSNNELLSVASSTVSSQIGNMLGSLSENLTVAPTLRSDRGDFSDVEVDVALTSRLLNNRLILNGNFGYRDPSINTNQFVGDFDVEYLLNPGGTWRLKAYNRYNDQNYYLRSAATTQGIGIVYTKDFNNFFGFIKRKKHKTNPTDTRSSDSTRVSPAPRQENL